MICLNMVVKNASKVIQKSLASVRPYIDSWAIVDVGSADGTQRMVYDSLRGVPGELYEREDLGGGNNRNMAMRLAQGKGDYLLFLDADQEFSFSSFAFPPLEAPCYYAYHRMEHCESLRILLVKQGLGWHWQGVVHENIYCPGQMPEAKVLEGARLVSHPPDRERLNEEIRLMQNDPTMFLHLAHANEKLGNQTKALELYEKKVSIGGAQYEIYYCLLRSAFLKGRLDRPAKDVLESFKQAHLVSPDRAESYAYLADYLRKRENHVMSYLLLKSVLSLPSPKQYFRVDADLYRFGRLALLAECAWRIGRISESYDAIEKLLAIEDLPEQIRINMEKNRALKMFDPFRSAYSIFGGALWQQQYL